MAEQRKTSRMRALNAAAVSTGFGRGIECSVRDVSSGGACLAFVHRHTALPREFALTIEPESTRWSCRLVWQSAYRAGVQFVSGC
jgi:hypothetical protein